MFAKTIIDSDSFLDMPLSAQALYMHLSMRADDDGFVNNPKRIQRMIGASEDDLRLLLAKSFILTFDTGIIVIKHWRINNYIQNDRYKATRYTDERSMLSLKDNNEYAFTDECIQNGYNLDTQYRLDKDSKDKDSKDKRGHFVPPSVDDVTAYVTEKGYRIDPEAFVDFYTSKGWKVGSNTMKDWKAAIRTWARRDKPTPKETPFNQFEHRNDDTDWDELEKTLMAN